MHALLSALFHATWIVVLLVAAAGAAAARPGVGTSGQGVQYLALFIAYLAVFGVNLVLDLLLAWHSLQGAPFEASKRRWVVPLLYACTAPLVATLGLTGGQAGRGGVGGGVDEVWLCFGGGRHRCLWLAIAASGLCLVTDEGSTLSVCLPAAWGSYVSTQLEPDCWQVEQRSAGASSVRQGGEGLPLGCCWAATLAVDGRSMAPRGRAC